MSIFGFLISDIFYKIQKFLVSSWASIIMHKDLLHLYYLDVDNSFGFDNKVDERKKITFLCVSRSGKKNCADDQIFCTDVRLHDCNF